jgi:hypothetical protein
MIHPNTELRLVSAVVGYGVYARSPIPRGTVVYLRDALEVVVAPDSPLLADPAYRPVIEKFSYLDDRCNRIISWDIAKYVNHCCHANTLSTGYGFEIAVRDIAAGEQITDDYRMFLAEGEAMPLVCDYADCRGVLRPDEFDSLADQWDAQVRVALADLPHVTQPLMPFMDRKLRQSLNRYLRTGRGYRSIHCMKPGHHQPATRTASRAVRRSAAPVAVAATRDA